MRDQLWSRSENWVGSEIDDSFVMVNIDSGKYVALNETATLIWETLTSPADQAAIESALIDNYEVSAEQCRGSVSAALERMQGLGLVSHVQR